MVTRQITTTETLAEAVERHTGSNPFLCYQCARCSSGCPVAEHMDMLPNQVMRAIQFNDESVLEANTPWICAACETCTTRCPQDLDIAAVMDVLRIRTRELGLKPPVKEVELFTKAFLSNIKVLGRLYEAGLLLTRNIMTLKPMQDVLDLGVQMIFKGKIRLLPEVVRPPGRVRQVEPGTNAIAYYPGCSLESTATEYHHTFKAICDALGIELIEPRGWICCGSTPAHTTDPVLAAYYAVVNLSIVERMGMDRMVAPCLGCYQRFRAAAHDWGRNPDIVAQVSKKIGYKYQGSVETIQAVETILEMSSLEAIQSKVEKPLAGLRVASYYGCALTRPPKYTQADNVEYPMSMDEIVRALGAEPVDWSGKTDCCGSSLGISQTDLALELSAGIIQNAQAYGADIMVTACPLCQVNVENRQVQMDLESQIPVLYITQLMALAFGMGEKKAELNKQIVDVRPILRERGILDS